MYAKNRPKKCDGNLPNLLNYNVDVAESINKSVRILDGMPTKY